MNAREFPVPTVDFIAILPVILLSLTGILALVIEMIQPKKDNRLTIGVSLFGLIAAGAAVVTNFGANPSETFGDMSLRDGFGSAISLILILVAFLAIVFSESYLREKKIAFGEFYPMTIWATTGAVLMSTTNNLLMVFIGLEVMSIALYVLAGLNRSEEKSEEAAIKYFLLGAFASAFLLYGIALDYGATGSLSLETIMIRAIHHNSTQLVLLLGGLGMLLVGLGFKAGLAPFHQWKPDVYQGAPTNVTAFMSALAKVAAFAVLWRVLVAYQPLREYWLTPLAWVAILSMVVGNVAAFVQTDVKRILGYSSIAHSGYLLVAVIAMGGVANGSMAVDPSTVVFYLLSYALMSVGAFAAIASLAKEGNEKTEIKDLNGLWKGNPVAAASLAVLMVSMAGLPITSGFLGKLLIFKDAINAGLAPLAIVLAIASVVSTFYYLRIAYAAFVSDETEKRTFIASKSIQAACVFCAAGVVLVMAFAGPIQTLLNQ